MIGSVTFKKFTGEKLPNVEEYVKNYCQSHDNIDVRIGTDSQNKGGRTTYCTIIAMYDHGDGEHGHGAHCVFKRWTTTRERDRNTRLLNEVGASIEVAENLKAVGVKTAEIDIDINPSPKFKSNEVYSAAKGWCEGLGYHTEFKRLGPLVTTLADWVVKS